MQGGINRLNKPKQSIKKYSLLFSRVDSCHHRVEGNTELLKRELVPQFGLYTLATKSFWVIGSSALDLPLHQQAKTPGTLSQDPIGYNLGVIVIAIAYVTSPRVLRLPRVLWPLTGAV